MGYKVTNDELDLEEIYLGRFRPTPFVLHPLTKFELPQREVELLGISAYQVKDRLIALSEELAEDKADTDER